MTQIARPKCKPEIFRYLSSMAISASLDRGTTGTNGWRFMAGDDHRLGAIMRTMAFGVLALSACGSEPAKQAASPPPTAQQIRQGVQNSAEGCSTAVSAMIDALTTGYFAAASGKAKEASNMCSGAHQNIVMLVGTDEDGPYSDCVGMTQLGKTLGDKTMTGLGDPALNLETGMQRLAENYRSSAALCLIAVKKVT